MKAKPFSLSVATFAVVVTSTSASPSPSPHPSASPGAVVEVFVARPDNPSDRINHRAVERAVERLMEIPTTAGAAVVAGSSKNFKEVEAPAPRVSEWFRYPSFFADYYYIDSHDERPLGPDGQTHSGGIGFDFTIPGDVLLGLTYSYSHQDLDSNLPGLGSETDSHFITAYMARSFLGWINLGVNGGGGTSDIDPDGLPGNSFETWSVTPFFGLFHSWGPFSFSSTAMYLFQDADGESSGKISVDLNLRYAFTERFSISGLVRYNDMVDHDDNIPEDRNWLTVGGKLAFKCTEHVGIYAAYEYDALNDNYENHTGRGGISVEF